MDRYKAVEFADIEKKRLWTEPNRKIIVEFDDEPVEMYWREAVLSSYCWKLSRLYKEIPIKAKYRVRAPITTKSVNKVWNSILEDIAPIVEKIGTNYDEIAKVIALEINKLYNDSVRYTKAYVRSPVARDLVELVHHPVMEKMYEEMKPSHSNQRKSYGETLEFIKNHPDMKTNAFANMVNEGSVNDKQFLTVAVGRYYANDIDNYQFRNPILSGYARGIHDIAWSAQESRDAVIAQLQAKEPVQQSDYLNRRLQMMTEVIAKNDVDDCGTTETIPWYVSDRDLEALKGIYRKTEDGEFVQITEEDTDLIGETIQIRSAATCHLLHKHGCCHKCLGRISNQLPLDYSIGHLAVMGALGDFIQLSLSAKHLIVSKETATFVLDKDTAEFLKFPRADEKNTLVLQPKVIRKDTTVEFIFSLKNLKFISDLNDGIRPEDIQLSTATFIDKCNAMMTTKRGDILSQVLTVSDMGRSSHFSREFISYVIDNPDMIIPHRKQSVKINLDKWERRLPMFNIPMKATGVKDFMKSFQSTILNGCVNYGIDAQLPSGISDMMRMLYNIVRGCTFISISHLGVIVASLLIRDAQALDYRLPLPGGKREFAKLANIFANRSISQMLAYERRLDYMTSPSLTLVPVRANHPFDSLYFPEKMDVYADVRKAHERGDMPAWALPLQLKDVTK